MAESVLSLLLFYSFLRLDFIWVKSASHGITIGPSLGNPNSSSDISRSSRKTGVLRYAKGTTKQTSNDRWATPCGGEDEDEHRATAMVQRRAFSASRAEKTCAMTAASHGITMGPSLGNPNSSSDISRSSRKIKVLRYAKGTTKRPPSRDDGRGSIPSGGAAEEQHREPAMAPIIAFSASRGVRLRSTEMTCAMRAASHGITMGPSLGNPNSSSDIWRSSRKMKVLRYAKGTTKRSLSRE
ncbi:unnamed protein product [Spirodela intermedia]|uniref:Uncharacterized protein n=1 Tax=Spirodela intermedia TaxID=51605 RepID=A0A7I8IZ55_SPIIN|nr:unnamed protein product [Spirodela intermedia]CAA6663254.1 unnamed protein product [Spirodela intermedia]